VIYGAPGCGKTTRLMEILEEELTRHDPDKIAFVSFTRKGTYEGAERAKIKFGYKDADIPYFRTLHSVAFRRGQFSKYDMISKRDYKAFSIAMGMKFTGYYTEDFYGNDDKYLFMHFLKRNNPRAAELYARDMNARRLQEVEHNFVRYKEFAKVRDFTDIIEHFIEVNDPLPVEVAIIDEAQDLTTLQWKMCEVAFRNCERVYIAGDDDQAIYEWSGADVQRFLKLNDEASEREVLNKSYRLRTNILHLARSVSARIESRVNKIFDAVGTGGDVSFHNSLNEIPIVTGETYYFLSRNNYFLSTYRTLLKSRACVYVDKDVMSYDPRQVEAINVFEAARKRGKMLDIDEVKLKLHWKDAPTLCVPWYDALNFDNDAIAYYKDLIKNKTKLKDQRIMINTIHGVKGGEADNVVLMLDFTRAVKVNFESNPDSELRCLYVACTRAKQNLRIVHSNTKNGYEEYVRFN
jgi:superfamily I DNA/RNA helicase